MINVSSHKYKAQWILYIRSSVVWYRCVDIFFFLVWADEDRVCHRSKGAQWCWLFHYENVCRCILFLIYISLAWNVYVWYTQVLFKYKSRQCFTRHWIEKERLAFWFVWIKLSFALIVEIKLLIVSCEVDMSYICHCTCR